jgi:hypothetical protein
MRGRRDLPESVSFPLATLVGFTIIGIGVGRLLSGGGSEVPNSVLTGFGFWMVCAAVVDRFQRDD